LLGQVCGFECVSVATTAGLLKLALIQGLARYGTCLFLKADVQHRLQGAVDEGGITSCVRQTMRQAVGRNMLDLLNIL
jgi:hypothetical protein